MVAFATISTSVLLLLVLPYAAMVVGSCAAKQRKCPLHADKGVHVQMAQQKVIGNSIHEGSVCACVKLSSAEILVGVVNTGGCARCAHDPDLRAALCKV